MSALSLAQTTLVAKMTMDFAESLAEKFSGKDFSAEDIATDDDLLKFFKSTTKEVKKVPNKSASPKKSPQERAMEKPNEDKCQARTWGGGYGGQCSKKKGEGGCFCKMHQEEADDNDGKWWLGLVTEPRPETSQNPSGKGGKKDGLHVWKTTLSGEEVVKKKASPKKKVSPKKVSPKKKVKEDTALSIKELQALIEKASKKKEEVEEVEEDNGEGVGFPKSDSEDRVFEGVEYIYLKKTNMIMDPHNLTEMGEWDSEEECIRFEDEESEENHQKYVSENQ